MEALEATTSTAHTSVVVIYNSRLSSLQKAVKFFKDSFRFSTHKKKMHKNMAVLM